MRTTFLGAIDSFAALLARRLDAGVPTLEDGVRYTLFAALLRAGVEPDRIVPEYPHPASGLIDTVLLDDGGEPQVALEFKYDRTGGPMSQKAGAALADLAKLGYCPPWSGRFFVYVTGEDMTKYLANPANRLRGLLDYPKAVALRPEAVADLAATVRARAGDLSAAPLLTTVLRSALTLKHVLRVIEVA
jgi:hypothetical protein